MLDYQALRQVRSRVTGLAPDLAQERKAEQNRRQALARMRAGRALATAYPEDFKVLLTAALKEVAEERGCLPGDE